MLPAQTKFMININENVYKLMKSLQKLFDMLLTFISAYSYYLIS